MKKCEFNLFQGLIKTDLRSLLASSGIDKKTIDFIVSKAFTIDLERGEVFSPSFEMAALSFIQNGMLRADIEYPNKSVLCAGVFMPKTLIAYLSPEVDRVSNNVIYTSLCTTSIVAVPGDVVLKATRKSQEFVDFSIFAGVKNNRFILDWVLLRDSTDKRQRILQFLSIFFLYQNEASFSDAPLRYDDISSVCRVSRQFCSTVIRELCEGSILTKRYGKIWVNDLEGLLNMVNIDELEYFTKFTYPTLYPSAS